MMWAYVELGWGGYWFWDPVENASLLPWLTGTAFLHSVMIQEKRGMLKMWNVLLVIATFLLSIFATFLTRSGLIESVHSFAENTTIAYIFLGFLSALVLASAGLVWWRRHALHAPRTGWRASSRREAAFLVNNLVFISVMFAVLWGTTFPLISEGLWAEDPGGAALLQPGEHPPGADPALPDGRGPGDRLAQGHAAQPQAQLRAAAGGRRGVGVALLRRAA